MLRIVLVSSPLTLQERYGKFSGAGNTEPTYALACLGAVAEREKMDVRVIDAAAQCMTVEQTVAEIADYHPHIVGISSTTSGIVASAELAKRVKDLDSRAMTIIGGCHVTALPEETLSEFSCFDMAVIGEGEVTFAEILRVADETGVAPESIAGAAVRVNDRIVVNPRRPFLDNLDELPLPAWKLFRGFPGDFYPSPARMNRFPCASVVLTRGCPNQCRFCDRSVFGNKVRSHSPAYAVDLIKDLASHYGVKEILIEDDTFIIARKRVTEFCERLIAENLDITWSCLGRADRVTPELLAIMKKAGCWHISYGIESGDQRILNAMQKNEDLSRMEDAVRWTREAGIRSKGFFMVGFPGETRESLRLTKAFMLKLPLDDVSVMQLTPFPGTAVYGNASDYGAFEKNWRKMNVLNTVFVPHGFTEEDMEQARADMLRAFYFRPTVIFRKFRDVVSNPRLFRHMLKGFGALLKVVGR